MNIPTPFETKKAKDQWIRYRLGTTDNGKYVKRGQALIIRNDPQGREEVMVANRNKVGAPFQYAESLFAVLAVVKSMTGLPYRYLQRMLIETLGDWDTLCCTTIYRRFQTLEVKRNGSVFTATGGGTALVHLAVDSPGLKQHSRGEWIRHKWKVRRGYVKIRVMIDVDTKKILAVQVTDDRTGDSPMLIPLLDEALEVATRAGQAQDSTAGAGRHRMLPVRRCHLRFQKQRGCMRGSWRGFTHQAQDKLDGARERDRRRWGIAVRKLGDSYQTR